MDFDEVEGLSPRTRGNPRDRCEGVEVVGSIPANAGEPQTCVPPTPRARVYPRERGGTVLTPPRGWSAAGLSPRTRGNHAGDRQRYFPTGSIPANAGEPRCAWRRACPAWVYPRERGGTGMRLAMIPPFPGLSPRTRGNLKEFLLQALFFGSIPANAGEPAPARPCPRRSRVYPRERGGTEGQTQREFAREGLSPRTRGNPSQSRHAKSYRGSIPANAGEPESNRVFCAVRRVYPRERGGTELQFAGLSFLDGLSPRTRGNRRDAKAALAAARSIPANAGEPRAHFR